MSINNLGTYWVGIVSSYFLGSCLFGVWLSGRNQGDPRHFGAQNNGLVLLARRLGWLRSLGISFLDISKGVIVILLARFFGPAGDNLFAPLCLVFLLLGHRYPLFRPPEFTAPPKKTAGFLARVSQGRFIGGVGATPLLGAFLVVAPTVTTICLILWVAAIYLWQYSAVANLVTLGSAVVLLAATGTSQIWLTVALFGSLLALRSYWSALKLLAQGKETRLLIYPGFSLATGMVATRVHGAYGDFFDYDMKKSRLTASGGATPWAFLVHPLDPEGFIDLDPKMAAALIRRAKSRQILLDNNNPGLLEALRRNGDRFDMVIKLMGVRPLGEGVFAARGRRTVGTFIFVPYLAERFAEAMVLRSEGYSDLYEEIMVAIVEAARQAHALGARVLGLGAFTSIISAGGEELVRRLHNIGIDDLIITSGNTYTAATLVQGALAGCQKMGKDPATSTVIMYGLGSVGTPASCLLATRFRRIILVARNKGKMSRLAKDLAVGVDRGQHEITYTDDLRAVLPQADVIVSAIGAAGTQGNDLDINLLPPGAVVVAGDRPFILPASAPLTRPDCLFLEGAVLEGPFWASCARFLAMGGENRAFGCLMETILRGADGDTVTHATGVKMDPAEIARLIDRAKFYGVRLSGFRWRGRRMHWLAILVIRAQAILARRRARENLAVANT